MKYELYDKISSNLFVIFGLNSCENQNPNINNTGKDEL
jgi:hypothetical protein